MKRVASLLFGTWLLTQSMLAAVAPAVTSGLLARFDFSNVNGKTTTDAIGGIEAQLMGAATIEQMGDYAVLNLGSANSWLDMTAAVGDLIKNRTSFSISCYYRVNDNQYISSNGNFLWSIASQQTCTATAGAYNAYRLNAQRVAHATAGYNTEKGIERGFESERGRWVSVLFVYNGSSTTGRLFVDGVFVANNTSMPKPATMFASAAPAYCYIGRPPFSGDIYLKNTLVTDFCVYSRALTIVDARNLAAECAKLDEAYMHREPYGDPTALLKEIDTAETLLADAADGYAPGAVAELADLIQIARQTAADPTFIQEVYTNMVTRLKAAETTLKNSRGYVALTPGTPATGERGFRHPGMLHTNADFERIKQQIADGEADVVAAYNILKKAEYSQSGVQTYPVETIVRGGGVGENYINAARGATMAYQNALRWKIDGTEANAKAAVRILMAWANTTKAISGDSNFALAAGLYGYAFANAAELVRDYSGWSRDDFLTFQRWMLEVWYPSSIDFLRRRNGTWENASGQGGGRPGHYWSNWGLCNVLCVMSIGILCDDVFIYNQGLSFYKYDQAGTFTATRGTTINNDGCCEFIGNLVPTVAADDRGPFGYLGQMQESGRDQGHATMAAGLAVDVCQTALNQGDDLYRAMDDRLAAGLEWVAAYNNSNVDDLPWTQYHYCDCRTAWHNGQWHDAPSTSGRGQTRPYWARVIGYYEGVRGVKMTYSEKALKDMGIDGGGQGSVSGGYDHMGYSVLTCTRPFATLKPTALTPQIVYNGKTLNASELGGLKNTWQTTASTAIPAGSQLTLRALLPDGEEDTGRWLWDDGTAASELSITANESRAYRVSYTNAQGVVSEQLFTIAVAGSSHAPNLTWEAIIDGVSYNALNLNVDYGKSITLSLASSEGYGTYHWDNGKTTQSITIPAVATSRDVVGTFTTQGGLNMQVVFHLNVQNAPSAIKAVESTRHAAPNGVYDLQGRRLSSQANGLSSSRQPSILIVNGKKVISKNH